MSKIKVEGNLTIPHRIVVSLDGKPLEGVIGISMDANVKHAWLKIDMVGDVELHLVGGSSLYCKKETDFKDES